jgi:putative toxin-antitoxin system antitoxin component (TIGR02293 family)
LLYLYTRIATKERPMDMKTVDQQLGGESGIGASVGTGMEWVEAVENGFFPNAVEAAVRSGLLTWDEVDQLVIPRRTLNHRRAHGRRLTLDESDCLLRVARVTADAEAAFANPEKARRWLRTPSRPLGHAVPLQKLRTSAGADLVREELVRIRHGIFA